MGKNRFFWIVSAIVIAEGMLALAVNDKLKFANFSKRVDIKPSATRTLSASQMNSKLTASHGIDPVKERAVVKESTSPVELRLEGEVVDRAYGDAVADALITVDGRSTYSDASGFFSIPVAEKITGTLVARKHGYIYEYVSGIDCSRQTKSCSFLNVALEALGKDQLVGSALSGIGVELAEVGQRLRVVGVANDGPAAQMGIHAGDVIEAIEGSSVKDLSIGDVVKKIRGRPLTQVLLTVRQEDGVHDFFITRERVTF